LFGGDGSGGDSNTELEEEEEDTEKTRRREARPGNLSRFARKLILFSSPCSSVSSVAPWFSSTMVQAGGMRTIRPRLDRLVLTQAGIRAARIALIYLSGAGSPAFVFAPSFTEPRRGAGRLRRTGRRSFSREGRRDLFGGRGGFARRARALRFRAEFRLVRWRTICAPGGDSSC